MGPLQGVHIIEFAGIGPAPLCAMLLADLGATIIRIDRVTPADIGLARPLEYDLVLRNRKTVRVDLKDPKGMALVQDLIARADAVIEGFRPGVMERLGLGPDECLQHNPRLVYGRMTGWGQHGPLAHSAGHDINYIAITGVLDAIGRKGAPPTVPLNVLGDYAGGSLYLAIGLLSGILEARSSGKGQVVDAAIVDGVTSLMTVLLGLWHAGMMNEGRGNNLLDSGSPFYDVYACADSQYVSVGPIERKFYLQLLDKLELDAPELREQYDRAHWPAIRDALGQRFASQPRAHWEQLLAGSDCCVSPVLDLAQAMQHPHLKARETFVEVDGILQPAPAPRFSRTPPARPTPPAAPTLENARAALAEWLPAASIDAYAAEGAFV
ncbi:CaiB/BaiF CoA transferase family protein [Pseudomonas asiatica]|uniref:CaiB/BaiF CoA transferase family protein n=1 Tax=Pseudomonas asiatica TaxID=2219225 RepID=UPI0010C07953|nr:CaiB/BaiF CoA-transferase family protein [Pseudomonas asiatica]